MLTDHQVHAYADKFLGLDLDREEMAFEIEDQCPDLNSFQIEQILDCLFQTEE